jgi:ATP-dependent Lon protease
MQESVRAAMSLLRSRAGDLGIPQDELENNDLHVHVPAGAIPKDGPSAGVAMFTALVSVLSGRSVNREVAMTGEISLRGVVLPIGGLKAKTIAALRAGIRKVIIPKLNEKDLPELPAEVRDHLEFVPVEKVEEVLEHALLAPDSTAQPAR